MRVLIACEFSGVVREAFRRRGHDAWSCDLLPTEIPGQHIAGDVLEVISDEWDLVIAHPPCTYICGMGMWWNHKRPERIPFMEAAIKFALRFVGCASHVAIENPIGCLSSRFRKPDQVINPWQFGHEANKPTCLWLEGLPKLVPTGIVGRGRFYIKGNGSRMSVWSHVTSGTRKEERARIASRTFTGIADAMAAQWGALIP